jgi:hypothetical protein
MICAEVRALRSGWEWCVEFHVLSYEEANQAEPMADSWMQPAQDPALGAPSLVLENVPEIPEESGRHVDQGGEVLRDKHLRGRAPKGSVITVRVLQ